MAEKMHLSLEEEARKEAWLSELSKFIIEANKNTWAADGAEVAPQRPGYKELEYKKGLWLLRDSYTGYFRAPGMTTVYHKDTPVWNMQYGGHGMTEGYEDRAKATYQFLRAALMQVSSKLLLRGPEHYEKEDYTYSFKLLDGDLIDCLWREEVTEGGILTFTQTGLAGIIIHRDPSREPILPWNT